MKSILAEFLIVGPLLALMWLSVGAMYLRAADSDPTARLVGLWGAFLGGLLPDTLAIAFVAGVFVGILPGVGILAQAEMRAGVAAALFSVFAGPALMLAAGIGSLQWPPTSIGSFAELCLMLLIMIPLSLTGAFPFIGASAVGGWFGIRLVTAGKVRCRATMTLLVAVTIGLILVHASLVRSSVRKSMRALPGIEAQVRANLIDLPKDAKWQVTLNGDWLAKVDSVSLQTPRVDLRILLKDGSTVRRGFLTVISPEAAGAKSKEDAGRSLRGHAVREPILAGLHKGAYGWEASVGTVDLLVDSKRSVYSD